MSWEDCGFQPGPVQGPAKCPKGACSDCDGEHHFYAHAVDPREDVSEEEPRGPIEAGHILFFACKHCPAWAEMVDEDDDDE